jgi:hypothetical protein
VGIASASRTEYPWFESYHGARFLGINGCIAVLLSKLDMQLSLCVFEKNEYLKKFKTVYHASGFSILKYAFV